MITLACPNCGARNADEFRYGGDASIVRPAHDDPSAEAWFRYVYIRDNPRGPHREFWQHVGGCRAWLVVTRDTRDHTVLAVERARKERGE